MFCDRIEIEKSQRCEWANGELNYTKIYYGGTAGAKTMDDGGTETNTFNIIICRENESAVSGYNKRATTHTKFNFSITFFALSQAGENIHINVMPSMSHSRQLHTKFNTKSSEFLVRSLERALAS